MGRDQAVLVDQILLQGGIQHLPDDRRKIRDRDAFVELLVPFPPGLLLGHVDGVPAVLVGLKLAQVIGEVVGLVHDYEHLIQRDPGPFLEVSQYRIDEYERVRRRHDIRVRQQVLHQLVRAHRRALAHLRERRRPLRRTQDVEPMLYRYPLEVREVRASEPLLGPAFVFGAELRDLLRRPGAEVRITPHHGTCVSGASLQGGAHHPSDRPAFADDLGLLGFGAREIDDLEALLPGERNRARQGGDGFARTGPRLDDGAHAVPGGPVDEIDQLPLSGTVPVREEVHVQDSEPRCQISSGSSS